VGANVKLLRDIDGLAIVRIVVDRIKHYGLITDIFVDDCL
jgi:hypothetical protein